MYVRQQGPQRVETHGWGFVIRGAPTTTNTVCGLCYSCGLEYKAVFVFGWAVVQWFETAPCRDSKKQASGYAGGAKIGIGRTVQMAFCGDAEIMTRLGLLSDRYWLLVAF
jgi:hypothetical protein